jgi:hypothetical protein
MMRKLQPNKAIAHAFRSVWTYRAEAIRIGLFWVPVIFVLNLIEMLVGPPDPEAAEISLKVVMPLLSLVAGLIGFSSMAVSWHRFILRDEAGNPMRLDGDVLRYTGNTILIMLAMAAPLSLLLVVLVMAGLPMVLLLPVAALAGAIVFRLSIKLPAVALGRRDFSLRDAWAASEGNFWQIVGLFALNAAVIFGVILALLMFTSTLAAVSESAAKVAALVLNAVVSLFITLFNASIFTSLYGFFVERRDF